MNFDELDRFFEKLNLPKLTQGEIEKFAQSCICQRNEIQQKCPPKEKPQAQMNLLLNSTKYLSKKDYQSHGNSFMVFFHRTSHNSVHWPPSNGHLGTFFSFPLTRINESSSASSYDSSHLHRFLVTVNFSEDMGILCFDVGCQTALQTGCANLYPSEVSVSQDPH